MTDDRRARQARAESILLLVTLTWGLTFPAIKLAVTEVSPSLFMFLRFALVIPGLYLVGRRRYFTQLGPTARNGILLGTLLWASYFFQALGLAWTTATRSGFITGLSVVFVPFLDAAIHRRHVGWRPLLGAAVSLAGLFLMTRPDAGGMNAGDLLTLGTAISYALYVVLLETRSDPSVEGAIVGWQAISLALLSLLAWPLLDSVGPGHRFAPGPNLTIGLLVTVPVAIFSLAALTRWQRATNSVRAGVIYSAEPLFAALFAFLWLGERIDATGLVGGALILLGIVIAVLG